MVSPVTIEAIVQVESKGDPLALLVNRLAVQPPRPRDAAEAARTAEVFIARGYSVDLGLMQVNSRNLPALGLTAAQILDPCTNIRAGAAILAANYARAVLTWGEGQRALQAALSAYNTGDFAKGFVNGYVGRYYAGAVPALASAPASESADVPSPPPPNPYTAATEIFARESTDAQ
jgi:type IV secretion system protein VirB1